ncbi:MAG: GAF domain-containing sensor histidine kinase [Pseudomonadota bacterium]
MDDSPEAIAHDIAAVARISSVPSLLRIVCDNTGMRFAAVARVTDGTWTACAVEDRIAFGLAPGGQLDIHTTLCKEARAARAPVVIDHASKDPVYASHHTPKIYGIESYISVPIVLPDGQYFGNLCAIDPAPAQVTNPKSVAMFESFAELIGRQLALERRQEETEIALLDARATGELREQFIAVLGHDLRNPLASVGAIGEVLVRNHEENVSRLGRRLRASTKRMSLLINDVLDFARGRMGSGMQLRIERIDDLQASLRDVISELRDSHTDRVIDEDLRIEGAIACDLGRVQQLFSNLLGNALTYGAADQPVLARAQLDNEWLCLEVINGGEPILAGSLAKIFEPYWRPPESKPGGGLGLGLHICSQIVRAHGGTLEVTSTAEHGTRFTARLPATAPAGLG